MDTKKDKKRHLSVEGIAAGFKKDKAEEPEAEEIHERHVDEEEISDLAGSGSRRNPGDVPIRLPEL